MNPVKPMFCMGMYDEEAGADVMVTMPTRVQTDELSALFGKPEGFMKADQIKQGVIAFEDEKECGEFANALEADTQVCGTATRHPVKLRFDWGVVLSGGSTSYSVCAGCDFVFSQVPVSVNKIDAFTFFGMVKQGRAVAVYFATGTKAPPPADLKAELGSPSTSRWGG